MSDGQSSGPLQAFYSRKLDGKINSCPQGFICNEEGEQANCTQIQDKAKELFKIGDIHGGAFCPENERSLRNCPVGSYCEDAGTIKPCPKGFFCPHKTRIPQIRCQNCGIGATQFQRQAYGYFVFGIPVAAILIYILYCACRNMVMKDKERRKILEIRLINAEHEREIKNKRRSQIELIRPKLHDIAERLGLSHIVKEGEQGIELEAEALFAKIDKSGDGFLSYDEIKKALNLKDVQSKEFVSIMNSRSESQGADSVEAGVFADLFLETMIRCSNFDPSPEDAAELYDCIYKEQLDADGDMINLNKLFDTRLSFFLSQKQIHDMIKMIKEANSSTSTLDVSSNQKQSLPQKKSMKHVFNSAMKDSFNSASNVNNETIGRQGFISIYPQVLFSVIQGNSIIPRGVDITFVDISLHINIGGNSTPVVDSVTGRLREKTMTAIMGGSGAGKTSLLNSLCGRAFYGKVTGNIFINGNQTTISEIKDSIGFVPQDDIVYSELTVLENFIFTGKFQLPVGTPIAHIEDLAHETIANLGLVNVAHNIVGDVTRRGVSGGEKKRVSIGLELMSKPSILFLDEPTSGLDASSAMLVMTVLRNLVDKQGVTVCCVIHQPRKFIYDLFDCLILLGVGGKMVYHGPSNKAKEYLNNLNYELPPGESVADWLIDISSGRLKPNKKLRRVESAGSTRKSITNSSFDIGNAPNSDFEEAKLNRAELYRKWCEHYEKLDHNALSFYKAPDSFPLPGSKSKPNFGKQLLHHVQRNFLVMKRNTESKLIDTAVMIMASVIIALMDGPLDLTREWHPHINDEFDVLTQNEIKYFIDWLPQLFKYAFKNSEPIEYAMKVGVITSVLIGLSATKVLTEKRLEFFRESGSGYNINAYFLAVNITSSVEHGSQLIFCAGISLWLRNSARSGLSYILNYISLGWICISWALLFPLIVPPKNVVLVTGFFMTFFGLLLSGALSPVLYEDLYDDKNTELAIISGLFSPTRYFIETMTVSEQRTLPAQSGFTVITSEAASLYNNATSFDLIGLAQNDMPDVTVQSSGGWFWGEWRSFLVGCTVRFAAFLALNICYRAKQAKVPFLKEMVTNRSALIAFNMMFIAFAAFLSLSVYYILN